MLLSFTYINSSGHSGSSNNIQIVNVDAVDSATLLIILDKNSIFLPPLLFV